LVLSGIRCGVVVAEAAGMAALDWGVYGAPETFLVDGNGIVRWKHVGPLSDGIIAKELMPALQRAEGPK
jgi:cytochrome c biogenesis protein CcmG/thiol:disulfide interchange protein DsbE